jgi:hypothetical protein
MTINVEKLNIKTYQDIFSSTPLVPSNLHLRIDRPLSQNLKHSLPAVKVHHFGPNLKLVQVDIDVPTIEFDVCEAALPLFLGIIQENMVEPVPEDMKEFGVVLAKLQVVDPKLWFVFICSHFNWAGHLMYRKTKKR